MSELIYKKESYSIVGVLFDVYDNLGAGFSEIVYKDAIEYEFKQKKISEFVTKTILSEKRKG